MKRKFSMFCYIAVLALAIFLTLGTMTVVFGSVQPLKSQVQHHLSVVPSLQPPSLQLYPVTLYNAKNTVLMPLRTGESSFTFKLPGGSWNEDTAIYLVLRPLGNVYPDFSVDLGETGIYFSSDLGEATLPHPLNAMRILITFERDPQTKELSVYFQDYVTGETVGADMEEKEDSLEISISSDINGLVMEYMTVVRR